MQEVAIEWYEKHDAATKDSRPYLAKQDRTGVTCKTKNFTVGMFAGVVAGSMAAMGGLGVLGVLSSNGPVAAGIDASTWQYSSSWNL